MTTAKKSELAIWTFAALGAGIGVGWIDLRSAEVQGPVVLLMLTAFAIALPGRAPVILIAVATGAGIPLVHVLAGETFSLGLLLPLIPALIAAGGGYAAGFLLDTAAVAVEAGTAPSGDRGPQRPLSARPPSRRFVLSAALVSNVIAGLPIARVALRSLGHPAANWLALVWQIMTLLGWIGFAPAVLRVRRIRDPELAEASAADILVHFSIALALIVIHSAVIVVLTGALAIPIVPGWASMFRSALEIYAPLDLLAYLSIVALGYASDVDRHRLAAEQREAALRAESLESRLSALRARLNPHFLFNALNSVHALSIAGRTDETTQMVRGLTSLLRYVLDERHSKVALSDELSFVREFLEVQRIRFGDRLHFKIDVDPKTADAIVPQLLLQPIVENAVEHGVSQTLNGGTVRVSARTTGERLEINVDDDGAGAAAHEGAAGIGLSSTRERLTRLYGPQASLTIERDNELPRTRVRIVLPFEPAAAV
jgi:two-component system LytT family sensor kinase